MRLARPCSALQAAILFTQLALHVPRRLRCGVLFCVPAGATLMGQSRPPHALSTLTTAVSFIQAAPQKFYIMLLAQAAKAQAA